MKTVAVHPEEWSEFCDAFTKLNKGTPISIEHQKLDGRRDEIAREEVFQKMTLDRTDACNDLISITMGLEGQRRVTHVVVEPIHLRVKQNGNGQKLLQIEAENGITLVGFHSGRLPALRFESEFRDINAAATAQNLDIPS
jgi:hypothetical protein